MLVSVGCMYICLSVCLSVCLLVIEVIGQSLRFVALLTCRYQVSTFGV